MKFVRINDNMKIDLPTILGLGSVSVLCIFAISMGIYDHDKVFMENSLQYNFEKSTEASIIHDKNKIPFSLIYTETASGTNPVTIKIDSEKDFWFYFGDPPESRPSYNVNDDSFTQLKNQIFDTSFFDLDDEYFPVGEPDSDRVYKIEIKTNDVSKSITWKPNTMVPNNLDNIHKILWEIANNTIKSSFVIEEDGILLIKETQEYKSLIEKYSEDVVSVKAVNLLKVEDTLFLKEIDDGFKQNPGCIIVIEYENDQGYVYQLDEELNIVYQMNLNDFAESVNKVNSHMLNDFYKSLK